MKKFGLLVTFMIMLVMFAFSASALESTGQCGDNVYWEFDENTGELVISGEGTMWDYAYSSQSPFHNSDIKSIVLKGKITKIGDLCFFGCESLSNVSISDDIAIIGDHAFSSCINLTSITIPDSVNFIGEGAFSGCSSLYTISIPDSVTYIGNYAFNSCYKLKSVNISSIEKWCNIDFGNKESNPLFYSANLYINNEIASDINIPNTVTKIKEYTFQGFSCLKNITISDSVSIIEDSAFDSCNNLMSITVDKNNKNYCSDESGVLYTKDKTKLIKYPAGKTDKTYHIPDNVNVIGVYAFSECKNINSLIIPEGVTVVEKYAFDNCSNLTDTTISNGVNVIGEFAFRNCKNITDLIIPESVTVIGDYAFDDCSNLTNITIPDTAISIGYNVFEDTKYYKNTSNWENSGLYIGKHLIVINANQSNTYTIKKDTLTIASHAFRDNPYETNVTIPENIIYIDSDAFYKICNYSKKLNRIDVDENNQYYSSDDFGVLYNKEKTRLIRYPAANTINSYIIPDGVTHIEADAFRGCKSINKISIPESVTDIEDPTFGGCANLMSIIVNENNNYYSNDELGVLFDKEKTLLINCPPYSKMTCYTIPDSVITIGAGAFNSCQNLTSIDIPNSVVTIGSGAFGSCDNLTSIDIPDSVVTIGAGAFGSCDNLTSINIPDSVVTIGRGAFTSCSNLTELMLPKSVREIGSIAFADCENLKYMTIHNNLNLLGVNAFFSSHLEYIYFVGTEEEWEELTKNNAQDISPIYINIPEIIYVDETHLTSMETVVLSPATCIEEGSKAVRCACGCGYIKNLEVIPMTEHDYKSLIVAPTCYAKGYTTYNCECGDSYIVGYVDMLPHAFTEWISAGNKSFRYCEACDYEETKFYTESGDIEIESPEQPDCDFDVDEPEKNSNTYILAQQVVADNTGNDTEVLKVFDITLKNHDGVHVQPDGSVKVKLPLDWEKDGNYKVYRVNDDGTLTDMYAYRQGSHMVFETDHFSIYVIVEEKTEDAPSEPETPSNNCTHICHKTGFMGFIWKILNFFQKLFGLNPVCECGMAHY